jgi:fructoselysine transporter
MSELKRELGLFRSTVINMIDMVGIGPFIVLPLVIQIMAGPWFILAWVAGALISFIDAMIWSELGAARPLAGGSYNFLRDAYGENKGGRMMSFLYIWQTIIQAPLVVASGAIGFSQYFSYLVPMDEMSKKIVSGTVVLLLIILLYRKISSVGNISVFLWVGVLATIGWIIWGGITNHHIENNFIPDDKSIMFSALFIAAIGQASVKTVYSYLGYYNVCHLGSEIKNPGKVIPASMFISIAGISILYLAMNVSVVSVIPWQQAQHSEFIVSTFIETIYGNQAAKYATAMVLLVAFASLFAVLLGYSRIPYAAAKDGRFFKMFARIHPTRNFPHVSLLFIGGLGFVFSLLFKLSDVITAILAMRIMIQFIGQAVGVVLLRKKYGSGNLPFRMWLYPLPVIAAIAVWLFVFVSTGPGFMISGLSVMATGLVVYLIQAVIKGYWPFNKSEGGQNSANPL